MTTCWIGLDVPFWRAAFRALPNAPAPPAPLQAAKAKTSNKERVLIKFASQTVSQ
jgi:hypothetical protein